MKKWNKGFILLFMLIIGLQLTACKSMKDGSPEGIKAYGTLVVATNAEFPPFEFMEDGTMVGWDVDVAKEFASRLGVTLDMKHMNFEAVLLMLNTNKAHIAMAGISKTPDREKGYDFTIGVFDSSQMIIVKNDNSNIVDGFDLAGKRVGAQAGTVGYYLADMDEYYAFDEDGKAILGEPATAVSYSSGMLAIQDLANGNLDAVILDKFPAEKIVASISGVKILVDAPVYNDEYAFVVKKGNTSLVEWLNEQITQMKVTGGFFDDLNNKWFE